MILLAAGPDGRSLLFSNIDGRKVRTPQSSVPDNVREDWVPRPFVFFAKGGRLGSTESATENIPPGPQGSGKGEKVR